MTAALWLSVAVAGLVSLLAPVVLRPLLRRSGVFDVPNGRSSHTSPTLRGGGAAALLGVGLGGAFGLPGLEGVNGAQAFSVFLGAALAMGVVGLVEDIRGLRVPARAALQFAVGAAIAYAVGAGWVWIPLAALFFAAHVNFTNFMDGVNGISSLHGLVAGLAYAALGVVGNLVWLQFAGLVVASAFIAFLPWNLLPPGMFLGDSGSYLLGGSLGALAIGCLVAGLHPLAAVAPLFVYWVDCVSTLARRSVRREPIFQAHRTHVYQRLTDSGLSHIDVAVVVALLTGVLSAMGLVVAAGTVEDVTSVAIATAGLAIAYLLLPGLRVFRRRGVA